MKRVMLDGFQTKEPKTATSNKNNNLHFALNLT